MLTTEQKNGVIKFILQTLQVKGPQTEKEILTKVYLSLNEIIPESIFITLKARNKIRFVDRKWQLVNNNPGVA